MMNQFTGHTGRYGRYDRRYTDRGSTGFCPSSGNRTAPHTENRSACGCGAIVPSHEGAGCVTGKPNHDRRLLDQIRAVDFALYETVLYLDVYPHSCDALETYQKLRAQSEALHNEYEASHGPLTAFGNRSGTDWNWMSKPFPWDYEAD